MTPIDKLTEKAAPVRDERATPPAADTVSVELTREQIRRIIPACNAWKFEVGLEEAERFAREAIAEFCRVNGYPPPGANP